MTLHGWRLVALTTDFPHHAGGSGYGQLARLISYDGIVTPPTGAVAKLYNRFVRWTTTNRFLRRLTRRRIGTEVSYLWRHRMKSRCLVHAFYGEHHSWLLRALPKRRDERRVMTIHLPPSLWNVSFKFGQIRKFDAVILMSYNQVEPVKHQLGYRGLIEVIEHGVDIDRFSYKERELLSDQIRCIMVGNFLRDYQALADFANYCHEFAPEIHFDVVASVEAAKPIQGLPNVRHHQGISDKVLVELYHKATVGLFTLSDCTANNAVLEAMATGLPIVVNDVGGIRTYVDEEFGIFIQKDDLMGMADKIKALISDKASYKNKAQDARRRAELFQWKNIAKRTADLYERVILQ